MSGPTALAPPLQSSCSSRPRSTRGLEQGSGPGVCWGLSRDGPKASGPRLWTAGLSPGAARGAQIVEGGGAVSHEEVFDFLGAPASVCATEGDVVPSAVSCQGSELKRVVRDAPAPLFDRVEVARSISPGRGVIKDPPEFFQEEWEVRGHSWVTSHRCHCPIQGPVS